MPDSETVRRLRPDWLRTCAHEAGHAVIATVLGIPVDRAEVWYVGTGRNTRVAGMMYPLRGSRRQRLTGAQLADAQLLMALAGSAAEATWLRRFGQSGDGAGRLGAGAAQREADAWSGGDLRNARAAVRAGAVLTLAEGRARARSLVGDHWRGIIGTASELARRGVVAGSSVRVS